MPSDGKMNRRSVLKHGAWMAGAGMLVTPMLPEQSYRPRAAVSGPIFNVTDYGATGKRADNATQAFRDAIEACVTRGGGTVNVPPGEYTTGTIVLKDNVTLNIEAGATIFLSQSRDDFERGSRSLIYARDAKNISVTGGGTLDGLARYVFEEMRGVDTYIIEAIETARAAGVDMRRYYRDSEAMNTYMFILDDCYNVLLEGISIIHSPLWNVRLNNCDRVHVRGVYIYSDLEKGVNADGIDICSTSNVTISDSIIVTADDSIVLKTPGREGQEVRTAENIVVTNCVLSSSSCALKFGTETFADIKHVVFNNCTIRNTNKGMGIDVMDGASVSHVIFNNITIEANRRHWNWWGDADMIKVLLEKRNPESKLGEIRDIVISNVISHSRGTSVFTGHPDQPLENITISNVHQYMDIEDYQDKRATHSLEFEYVDGLKIRDYSVEWREDQTEPRWQSALVLKDVKDFVIDSFEGRQGLRGSNDPTILIENSSDGIIRASRATEGTGTFIHIKGSASKDIIVNNNYVKKAGREITFEEESLRQGVEVISL